MSDFTCEEIDSWSVIPETPVNWFSGHHVKHNESNELIYVEIVDVYTYVCRNNTCTNTLNCIHTVCVEIYVSKSLDINVSQYNLDNMIDFCKKIGIDEKYFLYGCVYFPIENNSINSLIKPYFDNFNLESLDKLVNFIEDHVIRYTKHEFVQHDQLQHIIRLSHIDWKTYFIALNLLRNLSSQKYTNILDETINQKYLFLKNAESELVKQFYTDQLSMISYDTGCIASCE